MLSKCLAQVQETACISFFRSQTLASRQRLSAFLPSADIFPRPIVSSFPPLIGSSFQSNTVLLGKRSPGGYFGLPIGRSPPRHKLFQPPTTRSGFYFPVFFSGTSELSFSHSRWIILRGFKMPMSHSPGPAKSLPSYRKQPLSAYI